MVSSLCDGGPLAAFTPGTEPTAVLDIARQDDLPRRQVRRARRARQTGAACRSPSTTPSCTPTMPQRRHVLQRDHGPADASSLGALPRCPRRARRHARLRPGPRGRRGPSAALRLPRHRLPLRPIYGRILDRGIEHYPEPRINRKERDQPQRRRSRRLLVRSERSLPRDPHRPVRRLAGGLGPTTPDPGNGRRST